MWLLYGSRPRVATADTPLGGQSHARFLPFGWWHTLASMGHGTAVRGRSPILWLAVAGAVVIGSGAVRADDIHAIADRVLACTVSVSCRVEGGSFSGSGFVVSPDGHIITTASVVPGGAADITVLLPNFQRRPASVVAADESL